MEAINVLHSVNAHNNFLISHFNLFWNALSLILHAEVVESFDSEPIKAENVSEDFSSAPEDTFEVIDAPSVATYDSYPDPESDFFGGKLAIFDAWLITRSLINNTKCLFYSLHCTEWVFLCALCVTTIFVFMFRSCRTRGTSVWWPRG
jgi:hypothetical protein